MPFLELRSEIAREAARLLGPSVSESTLLQEFSVPPNMQVGHVALPCFRLSKAVGKPNVEVAKQLVAQWALPGVTATAAGPYVNFKWDAAHLFDVALGAIFTEGDAYGKDSEPHPGQILLEYCSPNIAKKLAFQHIRSTLIGNVLANVYAHLGYRVTRINFVGDWGTQFARLLAAVELWSDAKRFAPGGDPSKQMDELYELYVRFHKQVDDDPSLETLGAKALQRLESGEPAATELWKKIRAVSIQTAEKTLLRLGVKFDLVEGESSYVASMAPVLEDVKKKAGGVLSEGAWIVEVEGIQTPALIQKRDGTTLYLTRDIAAAIDRWQRFQFEKSLYVVSEQQRLHFQLLFGVIAKMGLEWAARCQHISFGTVLFGQEKMSTREGRVIFLDALLDEAKARALAECTKRNPELKSKEQVAEMVGVGAVIFGELSSGRQRDIEFNWDHILAFDGETGPYVQYSLVRCRSLLEKAAEKGSPVVRLTKAPAGYTFASEEELLALQLCRLRAALHHCVKDDDPSPLTGYLIDVAKAFNRFYYQLPVLQASDETQRAVRVSLVEATAQVFALGLKLLGMGCPKEM